MTQIKAAPASLAEAFKKHAKPTYTKNGLQDFLDQAGFKALLDDYDTDGSGGLSINEMRVLANQGLDVSHAASQFAAAHNGAFECETKETRLMRKEDIYAYTTSMIADQVVAYANMMEKDQVTRLSLPKLKEWFGYNQEKTYLDKYPKTYNCNLARSK